MRKISIIITLTMALIGAMALTAQAYHIDFEIGTDQAGALTFYNGGNNPLIGQSIKIDKISLVADNGAELQSTTGNWLWNFTTGNFSGNDGVHWLFSGGGTSTITGNSGGIDTPVPSGSFTTAEVHFFSGTSYAITGAFTDEKSASLLDFFGITDGNPFSATFTYAINLNGAILPPSAFPESSLQFVSSGNIDNFPVPVPPSAVLLGTGLVGLISLRFRRK